MCFSLFFIALSLSLSCSFSVSSLPSCDAHFWDVVSCKDRTGSSVMFQSASSDLTRQLSKNPEGRLNVFSCFFSYESHQLWLTNLWDLHWPREKMDIRWKWMLPYLIIDFPNRIFYGIFGSLIGPSQPYLAFATNVDLAKINLLWTLGKLIISLLGFNRVFFVERKLHSVFPTIQKIVMK